MKVCLMKMRRRTPQLTCSMKLNHFFKCALAWAFLYVAVMPCQVPGQTKPAPATTDESGTVRVLVAYHSLTGNTKKMAEGVVPNGDPA
jgi:hypothetical protein